MATAQRARHVPDDRVRAMPTMLTLVLRALFGIIGKVEVRGADRIPQDDRPLLVVANHVGFLDPLLVRLVMDRTLAFAIDRGMAGLWWVKPVTRFAPVFRVEPARPFALRGLMRTMATGTAGMIFPESRLTLTREIMKFYGGAAFAAMQTGARILPVHIAGMEQTPFTRLRPTQAVRQLRPKLVVTIGEPFMLPAPMPANGRLSRRASRASATREILRQVEELGLPPMDPSLRGRPWLRGMLDAHLRGRVLLEDGSMRPWSARMLRDAVDSDHAHQHPAALGQLLDRLAGDRPDAAILAADAARFAMAFELNAEDRLLSLLPPSHPIGVSAAAACLARAATLLAMPDKASLLTVLEHIYIRNPTLLIADQVTVARLTERADRFDLRSVRALIVTDGPVDRDLRLRVSERFGIRLLDVASAGDHAVVAANTQREGAAGTLGRLLPGIPAEIVARAILDDNGYVLGFAEGDTRSALATAA